MNRIPATMDTAYQSAKLEARRPVLRATAFLAAAQLEAFHSPDAARHIIEARTWLACAIADERLSR